MSGDLAGAGVPAEDFLQARPESRAPEPHSLATAPRCGARTRSGAPCRSPAIVGKARCRMHGGKGSGAPRGNRNGWKHGWHSARVREIARYVRATRPEASHRAEPHTRTVKDAGS